MEVFPSLILGHVIIETVHDMLTKFSKTKPSTFVGFEIEDAFEFIIDCYERLSMGIVEQHNIEFITFQL